MDEVFAGSCETVKKALSFISRQKRWPMFDREPIENWTKGRVTLLGDAGHAMLQYLAQGGCQAIEDAEYLTEMLNKYGDDYETAFEEYQKVRIPRSSFVQRSARKWGDIIHAEDPTIILLRDTIFANRTDTDYKFVDQFHGYNLKKKKLKLNS